MDHDAAGILPAQGDDRTADEIGGRVPGWAFLEALHRSALDQADILHPAADAAVEAKLFHTGLLPFGELVEGIYVMHEKNLLCSFMMEKESRPERTEWYRWKMVCSRYLVYGGGGEEVTAIYLNHNTQPPESGIMVTVCFTEVNEKGGVLFFSVEKALEIGYNRAQLITEQKRKRLEMGI